MATNCCHCDFLLVHEPYDIIGDLIHIVRLVVIRVTLVSVIEQPDISHISDFIVSSCEEGLEVFCGFDQFREPNKCGQILLFAWNVSASEFNSICIKNCSCL